jgi:hypothetical protein
MGLVESTDSWVDELKLDLESERPRCPFYGFLTVYGGMRDIQDNRCGLATSLYPCEMEQGGNVVNWDKCPFNIGHVREEIEGMGEFRVFPDELNSPQGGWSPGISLKGWIEHLLQGKPLRYD